MARLCSDVSHRQPPGPKRSSRVSILELGPAHPVNVRIQEDSHSRLQLNCCGWYARWEGEIKFGAKSGAKVLLPHIDYQTSTKVSDDERVGKWYLI